MQCHRKKTEAKNTNEEEELCSIGESNCEIKVYELFRSRLRDSAGV